MCWYPFLMKYSVASKAALTLSLSTKDTKGEVAFPKIKKGNLS